MVYFSVGNIEIYFRTIEGKFPTLSKLIVPADGTSWITVNPLDAAFILERIDKLPGNKDHQNPVFLETGKTIQLRAHNKEQKSGTTLELSHSTFTSDPTKIAMNRAFLKNALQFGCLRVGIASDTSDPVICLGEHKTFVFMPLDKTVEPECDAAKMSVATSATQPVVTPTAKETTATPSVQVKRRRRKVAVKPDATKPTTGKAALLLQAQEVRQALRTTLGQVDDLIREVKSQRSKDKLLQSTMDSLRKLSL